ncbi:MAG: DUF1674 domain-containing protein [Xanthobacteraceae bacterium]|nr:DUF1674 domain-containing protein [Xanthobacteraceae bacterium]
MNDKQTQSPQIPSPADEMPALRRPLPPEAQRALAEAEARRAAARETAEKENIHSSPKEVQGPAGPEPTRYGDWENKGIASDF